MSAATLGGAWRGARQPGYLFFISLVRAAGRRPSVRHESPVLRVCDASPAECCRSIS